MDGLRSHERGTQPPSRVMIVEDEDDMRFLLERMIRMRGHATVSFSGGQQALANLDVYEFDTVITDLRMPDMDGLELCARIRASHPYLGIVLVSAFGDMGSAVTAMRLGITDFLTKPVDLDELECAIARSHQRSALKFLRLQSNPFDASSERIIGSSFAIKEVIRRVRRFASSDSSLLIIGEQGTGKELIARALHEQSARQRRPFVSLDCAAISGELADRGLFRSPADFAQFATTDAEPFAAAFGGTLFLDQVDALPLGLQAKLTQLLLDRAAKEADSTSDLPAAMRVVATTSEDLEQAVERGDFHADLLRLLDILHLHVPPVRERETDAVELMNHFMAIHAARNRVPPSRLSKEAEGCVLNYPWPGNARELECCALAALAVAGGQAWITPDELPAEVREFQGAAADWLSSAQSLPSLELVQQRHIQRVLDAVRGNKAAAARILGINRVTLYRKLAQVEGK